LGKPDANKGLQNLKEQRAFEKCLFAKTKKPGGALLDTWTAFCLAHDLGPFPLFFILSPALVISYFLCLDETIDDGCVLWLPFCSHSSFVGGDVIYLYVGRSVLCGALVRVQDYRRDRSDHDRVAGEPSEGGHDGDCDQRANYFERLSDDEGEDAAENRAVL
jgi:hypothetical protein